MKRSSHGFSIISDSWDRFSSSIRLPLSGLQGPRGWVPGEDLGRGKKKEPLSQEPTHAPAGLHSNACGRAATHTADRRDLRIDRTGPEVRRKRVSQYHWAVTLQISISICPRPTPIRSHDGGLYLSWERSAAGSRRVERLLKLGNTA